MFANSYQSGFISIFFSVGSNPLALWDKQVKNGHIRRVIDDEVKSLVLDIGGTNVATTYITCPIKPRASLGVKLPYLVMIIKNMKKYFTFEIQILDDKEMRRRFRVSNFQSTTKVRPFCTTMPIGLSAGWNQVQFNLADFTKRAYGSVYMETTRVQIHANVRIRRIYFTDQLHSDEELPNEFKLFTSGPGGKIKPKERPSKEGLVSETVPPIKTNKKDEEEEIPPPPTPAEESPVVKEEAEIDIEEEIKLEVEGEEAPPEVEFVEIKQEPEEEIEPKQETDAPEGEAPAPEQEMAAPEQEMETEGEEVKLEAEEIKAEGVPEEEVQPEGEEPLVVKTEEGGEEVEDAEAQVMPKEETEQVFAEAEAEVMAEAPEENSKVESENVVVDSEVVTEVIEEITETEVTPSEPVDAENEET